MAIITQQKPSVPAATPSLFSITSTEVSHDACKSPFISYTTELPDDVSVEDETHYIVSLDGTDKVACLHLSEEHNMAIVDFPIDEDKSISELPTTAQIDFDENGNIHCQYGNCSFDVNALHH